MGIHSSTLPNKSPFSLLLLRVKSTPRLILVAIQTLVDLTMITAGADALPNVVSIVMDWKEQDHDQGKRGAHSCGI